MQNWVESLKPWVFYWEMMLVTQKNQDYIVGLKSFLRAMSKSW